MRQTETITWIPFCEEFPSEETEFLVCSVNGTIAPVCEIKKQYSRYSEITGVTASDGEYAVYNCVAWAKMPSGYQLKKEK